MPSQTHAPQDADLAAFFTGFDLLRETFAKFVASPELPKRLFIVHGVGGAGKSSLLRMFRLHCKNVHTPVAMVSGDDTKSAVEVLSRWRDGLQAAGTKLPNFDKTLGNYVRIQAHVDEQARRSQTETRKLADLAGKAASKTAESVAGAAAGAALGSVIPGIGTIAGGVLGGVIGGTSAEALTDWLRGFLSKPEIDLLLDPSKRLTVDFLLDVATLAPKRRLVLIIDTFEQMPGLEDWVCQFAQELHPNVLLVIAGRALPDWDREWPGWFAHAYMEELRPMTNDVMRQLIHRYYQHIRDSQPDPEQVEEIIRFARGLPLAATSAVQLWVRYGVKDFQEVKSQVEANLVKRLREGVPTALLPTLHAASAVRYFNKSILRAVMGQDDVDDVYDELLTFPFVRPRAGGFMLHDVVREMLDSNMRIQDPEHYRKLHEHAADYYRRQTANDHATIIGAPHLEHAYHLVCVDESRGIGLVQDIANEAIKLRSISSLRLLVSELHAYPLQNTTSVSWMTYYQARLDQLTGNSKKAEDALQAIANNKSCEPKLRAYALSAYGHILGDWSRLAKPGETEQVIGILEEALNLVPLDWHLTRNLINLARVYEFQGEWSKATNQLQIVQEYFTRTADNYGVALSFYEFMRLHLMRGDLRSAYAAHKRGLEVAELVQPNHALRATLLGSAITSVAHMGRYQECERKLRESINITRDIEDQRGLQGRLWRYGYALGMQGKYVASDEAFNESLGVLRAFGAENARRLSSASGYWGRVLCFKGDYDRALELLNRAQQPQVQASSKLELAWTNLWMADLFTFTRNFDQARSYYDQALLLTKPKRLNFFCGALVGLANLDFLQGHFTHVETRLLEAESLAKEFEFNDHLARIQLLRGHIASQQSDVTCQDFYRDALVYALRFNRFLCDEVLSGRTFGTLITPICNVASSRLIASLLDWWQSGTNDIGIPVLDTISPIPEGIPLIEAERIAREREPGDGSPQKTVLEQIEHVLR